MKNVLFIGGAGFIGSNLIKAMLSFNPDNRIYVTEPTFANVQRLDGLNIKLYRCELGNFDELSSIINRNKIDTVVHLVSTLIPGSNYEDYKREIQNVAFPTLRLTQFCSEKNIKFVFFSSGGTIYGNRMEPIPFKEDDNKEPISYYGLTKLMIENNILFQHRTQGLNYLILRPSNPYGHGQALNGNQGFIAVCIGKILNGKPIEVWGDGSSLRDYIYIDDLSNIFCKLISQDVNNEIINIGSGMGYSLIDVIKILEDCVDEDIKINYKSNRKVDVANMILSIEKLSCFIDLNLVPLNKGIKDFYLQEKSRV